MQTDKLFGRNAEVTCWCFRHMKEAKNAFDTEHPLHTFSIGIQGSPDLVAARKVAHFLGTEHHEFTFTVEEGIDALYDLIWHIESYEQVLHMPAPSLYQCQSLSLPVWDRS